MPALPLPDARKQRVAVEQAQSSRRVPVSGRVGRPPNPPVPLGEAGLRWWRWAWSTPQATLWNKGFHETLARRASLEDEYAKGENVDRARLLPIMARLDDSFALTPKAAVAQHLVFVDEPQPLKAVAGNGSDPKDPPAKNVTSMRTRLKGARPD